MRILRRAATLVLFLVVMAIAVRLAMPYMGRRLIQSDPLVPADAIVVLGSYRLERTLEAGTLFRQGWSRRIILMNSPNLGSRGVLRALNVHVPLWLDIQKSALLQMSVPAGAVATPRETQENTRAEAEYTAEFARRSGFKRVIVVTSPYHTGRAGRFFRKAAGNAFTVIMRADRYEPNDPEHWWRHPTDRADVVFEYLKSAHALTFRDD